MTAEPAPNSYFILNFYTVKHFKNLKGAGPQSPDTSGGWGPTGGRQPLGLPPVVSVAAQNKKL